MRVIIILLVVAVATAAGGWMVRRHDPIAAGLLFAFAVAVAVVLAGAFFGFIGV